jgi:hypothetical protein
VDDIPADYNSHAILIERERHLFGFLKGGTAYDEDDHIGGSS